MKVFGVAGWKNSGKTHLVERLLAEFTVQGLRVSTIKHAHHQVDLDQPGKDSHRHRTAGAEEVMVVSGARWALMHELRKEPEPTLDELLAKMTTVDLVLVEGFKTGPHPKIEVNRAGTGQPLLALDDPSIRAVATDTPEVYALDRPVLQLDDTTAIAALIRAELRL